MNTKNRLLILTSLAALMVLIPAVLAASFIESPGLSSGTAILYAGGAVGMFIWVKKIKAKAVSDTRKTLHYVAMGLSAALILVNVGSIFVDLSGYTPILGIGLVAVGGIIFYDSRKEKKEGIASTGDEEAQADDKIEELAVGGGDAAGMGGGTKMKHLAKDIEETDEKEKELEEDIAKEFKDEGGVPPELAEKEEEMEQLSEKTKKEFVEAGGADNIAETLTAAGESPHVAKKLGKKLRKAILHQHKDAIKRLDSDIKLNNEEIDTLKAVIGFKHISDKDKAKFEKEIEKLEKENEAFEEMKGLEKEEEKEFNKLIKKEEQASEEKQELIKPVQEDKEDLLEQYKVLEKEIKKDFEEIRKGEKDETLNIADLHVALKKRKAKANAVRELIKQKDEEIKLIKKGEIKAAKDVEEAAPEEAIAAEAEATGETPPPPPPESPEETPAAPED